jgi:hypothetical protein
MAADEAEVAAPRDPELLLLVQHIAPHLPKLAAIWRGALDDSGGVRFVQARACPEAVFGADGRAGAAYRADSSTIVLCPAYAAASDGGRRALLMAHALVHHALDRVACGLPQAQEEALVGELMPVLAEALHATDGEVARSLRARLAVCAGGWGG